MKKVVGGPGTVTGLLLRIGQCFFAAASMGAMVSALGSTSYTAFCYLIASMGLQVLWSSGLAGLDIYALRIKRDLQNPVLVSLFVVGDWVTATLSLAAACSSAGVTVLYIRDTDYCKSHPLLQCHSFFFMIFTHARPCGFKPETSNLETSNPMWETSEVTHGTTGLLKLKRQKVLKISCDVVGEGGGRWKKFLASIIEIHEVILHSWWHCSSHEELTSPQPLESAQDHPASQLASCLRNKSSSGA